MLWQHVATASNGASCKMKAVYVNASFVVSRDWFSAHSASWEHFV